MKRILVVDDNTLMRKLIVNAFKRDDLEFYEASDGTEGLRMLTERHYDLVVTDIIMPNMEGIELILETKHHFPGLNIIAISGGEPFYLYMAKKLGIQGIFTKPLNQKEFSNTICKILQIPHYTSKAS
jgi:YesN/AraC family two-component response regulator